MTEQATVTAQDIDRYMAQVEASGVLGRSKRRIRLLGHLIRSEALGQGDRLKAYSIGLDIFGKPDAFDPASDSVVRVEMGRLRSALALFEASEFADTRLLVDIPVGTYRPTISLRPMIATQQAGAASPDAPPGQRRRSLPVLGGMGFAAIAVVIAVALLLFGKPVDLSARPAIGVQIGDVVSTAQTAASVKSALIRALSRSKSITVLDAPSGSNIHPDANFVVAAQVLDDGGTRYVGIELMDATSGRVIWAKSLPVDDEAELAGLIEAKLARELRIRLFGASKALLERMDEDDLSPEALFVLATWVPGVAQSAIDWEQSRIALAFKALEGDPEFGAAHSVLADKLAYLANVYGPADTEENRQAALWHAQRAMDLSPLDPDVMFNVAQSHWHSGRIGESRATMARVVELDPNHDLARFLRMAIPYTCAAAPDPVLDRAIAFDAGLSSDNPIRWLTLTWIGWMHAYRQEWQQALVAEEAAARIFQIPYTFMRRAMVLNQLGRTDSAAQVVAQQTTNWAGFEPNHFFTTTLPRLCSETPNPDRFIQYYADLSDMLHSAAK